MIKTLNNRVRPMRLARVACIVWLAAAGAMPVAAQQEAPAPKVEIDRTQLERRIAAVATLIEKSSAARQIEASGDARALEKRERARQIHRKAQQAFQAGENAQASRLLAEASAQMFEAVRLAAPEQITEKKARDDFAARVDSVKALLAAQKRISTEKQGTPGSAEAVQTVEKLLAEAERLAAANNVPRARAQLDQAYLVAKAAIGSLRGGDTLVRLLQFASKEEEYRYEIDRNDTHQMLIRVLLQEKGDRPQVRGFLDKARELRAQAETAAASGDHGAAIRLLEDSTRELVRAIRGAGVYIPG